MSDERLEDFNSALQSIVGILDKVASKHGGDFVGSIISYTIMNMLMDRNGNFSEQAAGTYLDGIRQEMENATRSNNLQVLQSH